MNAVVLVTLLCLLPSHDVRAQGAHPLQVGVFAGIGGNNAAGRDLSGTGQAGGQVSLLYYIGDGWAFGLATMGAENFANGDRVSIGCPVSLDPHVVVPCPVNYTISGTSVVVQRGFGGVGADAHWRVAVGLGGFRVFPQPRGDPRNLRETVSALGTNVEISRVIYSVGRAQLSLGIQDYFLSNVRSSTVVAWRFGAAVTYRP